MSNPRKYCAGATASTLPRCNRSDGTKAFTLLELLIVVAIIGVLVALTLPAAQAAREAARRMQCGSNLKQVALAMHNYHAAHKALPPGSCGCCWGTWLVAALPFLEEQTLADRYQNFGGYHTPPDASNLEFRYSHSVNWPISKQRFAVYSCPSDQWQVTLSPGGFTKHNYVANYGNTGYLWLDASLDPQQRAADPQLHYGNDTTVTYAGSPFSIDGPLNYHKRPVRFHHISDGTSKTLMFSETIQSEGISASQDDWRGTPWHGFFAGFTTYLGPNSADQDVVQNSSFCQNSNANPPCYDASADTSRPMTWAARSRHVGGVTTALCDSSVRFVSDEIELTVWRNLSSSRGGEAISE
jgi:prepilin-type N-terminal cleavage/methylation domain-containing protein